MRKKIVIILLLLMLPLSTYPNNKIFLIDGSNIYIKIFFFYFPLTKKIRSFFQESDNKLNLELEMKKNDLISEPRTPSIFDGDLTIRVQDIPLDFNGIANLPIVVRHNKKVSFKNVEFTIFRRDKILILYGRLDDLKINELSSNDYFRNRFKWKYPLYFDLRIEIDRETPITELEIN